MKPQRHFIVEIKSHRRKLKTEPNSIWGDTDLKALMREADIERKSESSIDGPRIFESRQGPLAKDLISAPNIVETHLADQGAAFALTSAHKPVDTNLSAMPSRDHKTRQSTVKEGAVLRELEGPATYAMLMELAQENVELAQRLCHQLEAENIELFQMIEHADLRMDISRLQSH
jgi:hypothetical protein